MSKIELKECQLLSDKLECHCGLLKHCQGCQPCAKWSFGELSIVKIRPPQVSGRFPMLSWPRLIFSTPLTITQGVFRVLYNFTWWVLKSRNLSWSLVPLWKSRNPLLESGYTSSSHATSLGVTQPFPTYHSLFFKQATFQEVTQHGYKLHNSQGVS